MKLPVFKAFGATYAFVFGNFFTCIQIVWLPLAIFFAGFYFAADTIFPIISALVHTMPETGSDAAQVMPNAALRLLAPIMQWQGVAFLVVLILTAIIAAGLLRFVVRGERPKLPFYLVFGGAELSLIFTWILVGLILLFVYIALILGVGSLAFVAASLSKALMPLVITIAVILCMLIMIWFLLRFSLAGAGAIAVRGIGIGAAWSAARGNGFNLLGFWILVFVPIIALGIVASSVMNVFLLPEFLSAFMGTGGHMSHEESAEAVDKVLAAIQANLPLFLGIGYVTRLITFPIMYCAGGVAYRMITEGEGVALQVQH